MEILKLIPAGKDYLWGGNRLKKEYGKNLDIDPLAETWECSTHSDGPSIVANGQYKDKTLTEVLKLHPEYLGTKVKGNTLPILVKYIDAKQDLSVQVHPDDDYALIHENQNGKTEMWYVIDAEENSSLIYGFEHKVSKDILTKALKSKTLAKHLHKEKVHKGDVFFVPPGTVHAIGKGILLAEIQESSNLTYRVYDYDRIDKNGKQRDLHFDKAIDVMNMDVAPDITQKQRIIHFSSGSSRELLCRCKYFEVNRIQVSKEVSFSVLDESFQVLMCLDGQGTIIVKDKDEYLSFSKGETLFIPSNIGRCVVEGKTTLLKIRI